MPESIANFAYAWMSALIVLGLGVIAWLLNKGFEAVKDILTGIREDLNSEKNERQALRTEFEAHKAACAARRDADPLLHHRLAG